MADYEQAVVDWLHSFESGKTCTQLAELSDGIVLANVLHEMCPESFDVDTLHRGIEDNAHLSASNIRAILRMLDEYFRSSLGKKIDMSFVDINEITKSKNLEEIVNLVELVVGVAVMCEQKAEFIKNIFLLNHSSQAILKELVESVLGRTADLDDEEGCGEGEDAKVEDAAVSDAPSDSNVKAGSSGMVSEEEFFRAKEMVQHLQSQNAKLLTEVRNLELSSESFKSQIQSLKDKSAQSDHIHDSRQQTDTVREQQYFKVFKELEDLKKEYDLKINENEKLRQDHKQLSSKLELSKEMNNKLELENRSFADELELAKDTATKLVKAEQTIEKYTKKLEEMMSLKKQNKDLNDQLDIYVDKIHDLESTNKSLSQTIKTYEGYKNKSIEIETEKLEMQSTLAVYKEQNATLREENQKLKDATHRLEKAMQEKLEALKEAQEGLGQDGVASQIGAGIGEEVDTTETVPQLKAKIRSLERQLKEVSNSPHASTESGVTPMIDNAALKAREDLLLSQKKRILELEDELSKAQQHQAHESESSSNHRVVEIESRLTASANTIKLLEDKLKEKETNINQLRQEKGKLETYAKRSLDTFKEKYMSTLKIMQAEKKEMADKMKAVVEKYEKGQETWRREERLMSSALFEMGLKIMDRKIQLTLNDPSGGMGIQGQAYLAIQRDALNKAALDSATKATSNSNGGDSSAPGGAVKNPFTPAK